MIKQNNDDNDEYLYNKRVFEKCLLSYMNKTLFFSKLSRINEIVNHEPERRWVAQGSTTS